MAASSTSASSSSNKVSRFSTTLKAFKFNGNSDKPPPPPPKDGSYYNLNLNRSFVSLAPESPLSPMNRSAMSLLSDVQSSRSLSPPEAVPPVPAYPQKKRGFFKFGRKSSKGSVESSTSPPPTDEGISLPWNFSHNIHVDEGFIGLPPTWTANLANAGFTEEEITAIQNRRQAARSPGPHYLYHNRPASPASLPTDPVLAYPSPRTTSLQHGRVPDTPSPPPMHPPIPSVASPVGIPVPKLSPPRFPQGTYDNYHIQNLNHHPTSSIGSLATSVLSHATTTSVASFIQEAPSIAGSASIRGLSPPPFQQSSTPPRWPFQIINDPQTASLPPSYNASGASYIVEQDEMRNVTPPLTSAPPTPEKPPQRLRELESDARVPNTSFTIPSPSSTHQQLLPVTMTTATSPTTTPSPTSTTSTYDTLTLGASTPDTLITRPPSTSSMSSSSSSTDTDTDTLRKRLTALPPRLSLHKSKDSTDLMSWGEALLSGISTSSGRGSASGMENVFASAQEAELGFGFGLGLGVGMVSSRSGDRGGRKEDVPMTNRDYYKRAEEKRASERMQGESKGASLVPPLKVNIRSTGASNGFDDDDEDEDGGDLVDRRRGVGGEDGPSSSVAEPAVTARYDPNATSWDEDDYMVGGDEHDVEGRSVNGRAVERTRGEWEDEEEDEEDEYVDEGDCGVSSASPLFKDIEGLLGTSNSSSTARRQVGDTPRVAELEPSYEDGGRQGGKRESSRSSTSTVLAESATISVARSVSVVRKVGRYVVGRSPVVERRDEAQKKEMEEGERIGQAQSGSQSQSQLRTQIHLHSPPQVQFQSDRSQPPPKPTRPAPPPPPSSSPLSSTSGSEGSGSVSESGSGSGSTSANGSENENEHSTPATEDMDEYSDVKELDYYYDRTTSGTGGVSPPVHPHLPTKEKGMVGGDVYPLEEKEELEELDHTTEKAQNIKPPTHSGIAIVSEDVPSTFPKHLQLHPPSPTHSIPAFAPVPMPISATSFVTTTPLSLFHRYPGWLSAIVRPLEEFIDDSIDPREFYLDLQEIAEGDSGFVYAARLASTPAIANLRLPPRVKMRDAEDLASGCPKVVAIKSVAILPTGSPKLVDLERELRLMRELMGEGEGQGKGHENVLGMEAVYVDLLEDAMWIRMELMERSLADIVELVPSGLILGDRTVARFASDVLQALEFLQHHRIAHRDVRSDNLLVNSQGVLKLTDFSNAIQLPKESSMNSDLVGVVYWQAPEIRSPPYDALKVDVWSLGATVWEMAEAQPPFAKTQQLADRWPPLSRPHLLSPAYHEFLRFCSQPSATRPSPTELTKHPFINNACGRQVIIQLIDRCITIEQDLPAGDVSRGFKE